MKKIWVVIFLILNSFTVKTNSVYVVRIVDGDTFVCDGGETVRLIGINAPEISDIFGFEAKNYLSKLILNTNVNLVSDNYSKDRDRYNRLLRYVFLDTIDINKKMIMDGFAFAYLKYKFNLETEYRASQNFAKNNSFGIWDGDEEKQLLKTEKKFNNINVKTVIPFISVIVLLILGFYYYYF